MIGRMHLKNSKIEGQCTIKQVEAVWRNSCLRLAVICFSIVPLCGIPLLLLQWFPCLKRKLYYSECQLEEATHLWVVNSDDIEEGVPLEYGQLVLGPDKYLNSYYFTNRLLRYYWNPAGWFEALEYDYRSRLISFSKSGVQGLSNHQAQLYQLTYGEGLMRFEKRECLYVTYEEMTRPLFLFVTFCILQMILTDYFEFGMCLLAFTLVALVFTVRGKLQAQDEMESMLTKEREYSVLRNNSIQVIQSTEVVPGDVVFFKDGTVPFDGVLVEGAVLIDEASLTGESFPVSKKELNLQEYCQTKSVPGESILFEGTRIVQCRNSSSREQGRLGVGMLVSLTSSSSYKGQIMRTIKFPRNSFVEFEREALILVGGMLIFVVVVDLLLFKILTHNPWKHKMFFRYLTLALITAVPPQLPTCMNVTAANSQRRLKQKGVFSNNLSKIIENGRVDLICFDKTGTLTRKDLQFEGYIPNIKGEPFDKQEMLGPANRHMFFEKESMHLEVEMAAKVFGCCHSLEYVQSSQKVDGDPIEVELFKFGGYQLDSSYKHTTKCIGRVTRVQAGRLPFDFVILRRFEFNSQLKRMSTIVQDLTNRGKYYVLTKGAPEGLAKLGTMPQSFDQVLQKYAQQGLRVLSMAYRELQQGETNTILRKDAESNLKFVGFVVFQNKLKIESSDIIGTLMTNNIRCVMLTGDNLLTAKSIAKQLNFNPEEVRARCTPQQKAQYVQEYIKQGYRVMMAGDGVNDMLALKTAHIGYGVDGGWGLDFIGSLGGILSILEEGRATIVAGMAMLKIAMTFGLLEFIAQTIAAMMYADINNAQYIYLDVFMNMLPIMLLPLAKPKPLSLKRPYSAVLSLPTFLSVLTPTVCSLFLSIGLAYREEHKLRNYHEIALMADQTPSRSNLPVSMLFVIAAGMTASSLVSMDWKFTWRKQNFLILSYATIAWTIVHIIPFVPLLQSLFAMSGHNQTKIWHAILLTDVMMVTTALFQRLIMPQLTSAHAEHNHAPIQISQTH